MNITESKALKRFLAVPLTTVEKVEYGRKLAHLHQEYGEVELDKKAAADRFKEQLDSLDSQSGRLAHIIKNGEETREVECLWRYDFQTNKKELIRMDTGEIVETAAITADERQLMLQMDHGKDAGEAVQQS